MIIGYDNTSVNAAIKGTDADLDLAVIAVPLKDIPSETLGQISVATLGNSDELKMVARALLPAEIMEGSRLKYEWMQYEII